MKINCCNNRPLESFSSTTLQPLLYYVKAILAQGADVDSRHENECTPLSIAAENGHSEIVNVSIRSGLLLNTITELCLLKFTDNVCPPVRITDTNSEQVLLEWGASIHARAQQQRTALMLASRNGHLSIVEVLLKPSIWD